MEDIARAEKGCSVVLVEWTKESVLKHSEKAALL